MKYLLPLFLFFIPPAFSSDCFEKIVAIGIGTKLKAHLIHEIYGEDGSGDKGSASPCESSSYLPEIEKDRDNKKKYISFLRNRLNSTGVLEPEYLQDIFTYRTFTKPLNRQEVCREIDREISKRLKEDCHSNELQNLLTGLNLNSPVKDMCQRLVPAIRKNRGSCEDSTAPAEVTREPPGEEIAPAEPARARSQTPNIPQKVMSGAPPIRTDSPRRSRSSSQ